MIISFGDASTEKFALEGKSKFSGLDSDVADQRLNELNAVSDLREISPLKSVNLHKLSGNYKEFWAMNINGPWRLIFKFSDGNAYEVTITDYH